MIETLLLGAGAVVAIALSAFCSGAETGIYCLNPVRLRVRAEQGSAAARKLTRLMERRDELVMTMLIGTNVTDYLASACVAALLIRAAVNARFIELYTMLILTPIILVFAGIIPKDWFRRRCDQLMYLASGPLTWFRRAAVAIGLIWLLRSITRLAMRCVDPRRAAPADVLPHTRMRRLISEGAARGGLTAFQRATMERVLRVSQVRLSDVMTPRKRCASVPRDIPRADLLRIARMSHFSRLPVYERDPHTVVGVINVYDVITDREQRPIAEYLRDVVRLPGDCSVPAAMVRLQRAREVMAIVEDSAGRFIGLFTMKDLVEEIVGELEAW